MSTARILIVEDEKIISLDLRHRLESFGFAVCGTAANAEEAIARVEELSPDLVLMDIMLPGDRDGIDAAYEIKKTSDVPLIFLTAYADDRTRERAKAAEPVGYVLKPFKDRELFTTIDIALYKSRIDRRLRHQERTMAAILNSIGDGLIATAGDERILFMNPVAERLTGWTGDDARDRPLSEVLTIRDDGSGPMTFGTPDLERPISFRNAELVNKHGDSLNIEGTLYAIHSTDPTAAGRAIAFRDVTHVKRLTEQVSYQASHDQLTGLINREEFFHRISRIVTDSLAPNAVHCLVYIDLDQFRVINDVCGHFAGDELIREVARDIPSVVDVAHVVSRLGGDEFGFILPDCDLESGLQIGRAIQTALYRRFTWGDNSFQISASIGLVPIDSSRAPDAYEILAAADDACYLAKEAGGNCVRVYETTDFLFEKRRGEMQWVARLQAALDDDRFVLYSQWIKPLKEGLKPKREILVRLTELDGTLVPPHDFIPAAEKYNFMPMIDRWIIAETIKYAATQRAIEGASDTFCINISGGSLIDDTLLEFILSQFTLYDADPASFCFEITETSAIQNLSHAGTLIRELKEKGATFALDDFGNGFSSFAYLKHLSVDFLKIDGSFVKGIGEDRIDYAMVLAVNDIGHALGMQTIAEFVQSQAIIDKLIAIGVDYAQGFEIARPVPLEPLEGEESEELA